MNFPNVTFWSHLLTTVGIEVCGVAALGFAAQLFFRSAAWPRTIWQMTVVCLLLLPASEWTGFGRGTAGFLFGHKQLWKNVPATGFAEFKSAVASMPVTAKLQLSPAMPHPAVWWPAWVWLAGAVIVLGRMAAAQILLLALRWRREKITSQSLRNRVASVARSIGLRRKVNLLRMPESISPMAFGILWPSIGLPPGFETKLSATEQEAVLAHELAHLAAMDPLWFLLADFASAWLWWHPLAWWVRRSLHGAAELAADEATALLPDGPGALANCLVSLGKEMTASRGWSWVGINGGFRSKLGQRVERLMRMTGGTKRPLAGWAGAAAKLAATILFVPTVVLLFGSFQSAQGQKEDSWRDQMRESWNSSPGAMLVLAALDDVQKPKEDIATRVQNGKLLYHKGKLDESEVVLMAVMKEDPANRAAAWYLNLIKEARYMEREREREAAVNKATNPIEQGNDKNQDMGARVTKGKLLYERGKIDEAEAVLVGVIKEDPANRSAPYYLDLIKEARFTGRAQKLQDVSGAMIITKGRQYILSKLDSIKIEEVSYDFPLKDVLLKLRTESQKRDPDGIGVNFMINQNVEGSTPFSTNTNGAISPRKTSQQKDIGTDVRIQISPSMHNVRLADVLDAITKAADSPIRYMVQDYAVVFSPGPSETDPSLVLYTKTFHVDSHVIIRNLPGLRKVPVTMEILNPDTSTTYPGRGTDDSSRRPGDSDHDFGVFGRLAAYFAAAGVNLAPPKFLFFNDGMGLLQVRATRQDLEIIQQAIEVLSQTPPRVMIEARFVEMDEAALQGLALDWNKLTREFTGTLTDKELHKEMAAIEQLPGVDVLSAPKAKTVSGQQAHIGRQRAIDLGISFGSSNGDGTGITLDVIPTIEPDGYMIQIAALSIIKTSHQTCQFTASRKIVDGETMVIGGVMTNQPSGATKVGVTFITSRIIDPVGNPAHTDEELSKHPDRPAQ